MAILEFIAFDANGKGVDWVDPVIRYHQIAEGVWEVDNGFGVYTVRVPKGGSYEVRERS